MKTFSATDHASVTQAPTFLFAPAIAPTGVDLKHLLQEAENGASFERFLQSLTIRDIIFECEGDGPLAQHPGFPGAVRQAIGSQLMKTASREALAGLPCPWSPACGFQVFFNAPKETVQSATKLPTTPWVLRCETADATSVRITLRLFGLGVLWCSEIADACHRAIEQGIYIGGLGPVCDSVIIRSVEKVWPDLGNASEAPNRAMISFISPYLCSQDDQDTRSVGQQFLDSMIDRASDVARWHGLDIEEALFELRDAIAQCECEEAGLTELKWNRAVSQHRSASVAMKGKTGLLQLGLADKESNALIQLLRIGELLHAGSMIAFGQGRYEVFLL